MLYRGAWMEWDLGMVDMAVPLSPDELIMKRHAIYRHLSQKDIMPFPGDDPRESGSAPKSARRTPRNSTTSSAWPIPGHRGIRQNVLIRQSNR